MSGSEQDRREQGRGNPLRNTSSDTSFTRYVFQVNAIMAGLPQDEDGRITIEDFITKDIYSEEVFEV